ncbi:hypothetical protein PR048_032288 [Dryococelus australis]|uniref:Uncharacterized protein n=1 Tax=Dryococelus australis TaxID=614101 RepID=A0ABQ9G1T3_9NEOP|nr:hypothetical protein PR048_032288 [Dryococelus australis]
MVMKGSDWTLDSVNHLHLRTTGRNTVETCGVDVVKRARKGRAGFGRSQEQTEGTRSSGGYK